MHEGWSLTVQPDCLKGRVVCGTVLGTYTEKISWDQSQEQGIVSRSWIFVYITYDAEKH